MGFKVSSNTKLFMILRFYHTSISSHFILLLKCTLVPWLNEKLGHTQTFLWPFSPVISRACHNYFGSVSFHHKLTVLLKWNICGNISIPLAFDRRREKWLSAFISILTIFFFLAFHLNMSLYHHKLYLNAVKRKCLHLHEGRNFN